MPYILPLLKNWASGLDQTLLKMLFDVGAQKIDGTILDTYGIVVTVFSVTDKLHAQRSLRLRKKAMPVTTSFILTSSH